MRRYNPVFMYFPIHFKVGGEPCLIVGGGPIAYRKTVSLLRAGARVTVVGPKFDPRFRKLEGVRLRGKRFSPRDLRDSVLAIAATDDRRVNEAVYDACRRLGIPVNVVDQPRISTFIMPAVVRSGPLTLTVSTQGISPALAKGLRRELRALFPKDYARFAEFMGRIRERIRAAIPPSVSRVRLLNRLASARVLRVLRRRGFSAARKAIGEMLRPLGIV